MRLTLIIVVCLFFKANCQPVQPGAEAAALGGSYITQTTIFSARHNTAGLAFLEQSGAGMGARNNYLVNGLNDFYALGAFKLEKSTIAIDLTYYGISTYQQGEFGFSYARKIASNWSIGARLCYAYNYIPQEGINRHLVGADLGVLGELGNWRIAASLQRFANSKWQGRIDEIEPVVFRLGGGYYFKHKTSITAELYKAANESPDVRLGLQYAVIDEIELRFGFATLQPNVSFGIGLNLKGIQINFAATWHQQLGLSPITDLVYAW